MLSERSLTQKHHSQEMPRKGQSVDGSWIGGCGGLGVGTGERTVNGHQGSHWGGRGLLKLVCSDGCVTLNYLVKITKLYA